MSGSGKFRLNEGDWICSDSQCGNVNFARRTTCNRCGKEKTSSPQRKKLGHEIGKAAAEKSRGLFSADDWQCGRCGNVNWARRQQCNMCNAPKFGEVEERTGLGGGYNERENIEYIEREESDGEYDDFGRKKKKFRGSLEDEEPLRIEAKVIEDRKDSLKQGANEEDDDDDDDDETDLSKYDLTGWGEEASPKKDKSHHEMSSRSHSSSSSHSSNASFSRSWSSSQSSQSSQSSRSSFPSSFGSASPNKIKRKHSRSRSSSLETNHSCKQLKSGSSQSLTSLLQWNSTSRDRDRSRSRSPVKHRK